MVFDVGRFGAFLSTRDRGAKVRGEFEQYAQKMKAGETATISFQGVEAVTISFADEFVGRLFSSRAAGDLPEIGLVITGANEDIKEALTICLDRRDSVAAVRRGRSLDLLTLDDHMSETFEVARDLKKFKASDIAAELGISAQNANNRLKKFVDAGALTRQRTAPDGGGKEFLYSLPT